jgi:FtsZ-binding cell division protein ZapB
MSWFLLLASAAEEVAKDPDGGWAAWLNDYGPWAVVIGLTVAVIAMAKHIVGLHEKEQGPTPEQAREIREAQALRDKNTYDLLHKELFDQLHDKLVPLIAAIEANTLTVDELKTEADQLFNDAIKKKDQVITDLARQKDEVGKEAMTKMEELYGQMLGLVERVIGAAEVLKQYAAVLEQLKNKGGGDPPEAGAPA